MQEPLTKIHLPNEKVCLPKWERKNEKEINWKKTSKRGDGWRRTIRMRANRKRIEFLGLVNFNERHLESRRATRLDRS